MKQITLHTAALDNAGIRHDGGTVLAVGKAPDAIGADRAAELVALGMASADRSGDTAQNEAAPAA